MVEANHFFDGVLYMFQNRNDLKLIGISKYALNKSISLKVMFRNVSLDVIYIVIKEKNMPSLGDLMHVI